MSALRKSSLDAPQLWLLVLAGGVVMGTYVCGLLGGHHRRKYLLAGIYLIRAAAIALFVLLPLSTWTVYVFAAVMGFIWLGTVPLTNGLISQVFGVRYITTLFGFVFFGHQLGSFLGVWPRSPWPGPGAAGAACPRPW